MKKAKIVLSAVALLAVVGGALAFKAARIPVSLYVETAPGSNLCTTTRAVTFTTLTNPNSFKYNTLPGTCPFTGYYTIEE